MRLRSAGPIKVNDNTLAIYLKEIARYHPLSSAEEARLAAGIQRGESAALNTLVQSNLRFVVSVARTYQYQGLSLADLINEGNLGLLRAAGKFDASKNFRFISYAVWWIRQAILQGLANQSRVLRIPLNRVSTIQQLEKTRARLEQQFRRLPNTQEVAAALGLSEREVVHTMHAEATHASLDAPRAPDSDSTLLGLLSDQDQPLPDAILSTAAVHQTIEQLLNVLTKRERGIICLYFGIGEDTSLTLDEVAQRYDITRERVRQIKKNALAKLKCAHLSEKKNVCY